MIKLIFKKSIEENLRKCSIIDNMRTEIENKVKEGVTFSNEATLALSVFPKSDTQTYFFAESKKIDVYVKAQEATREIKTAGYAIPFFFNKESEEDNTICYCINKFELEKIGWTDAAVVPKFVIEVFTKLDCMPDEITE